MRLKFTYMNSEELSVFPLINAYRNVQYVRKARKEIAKMHNILFKAWAEDKDDWAYTELEELQQDRDYLKGIEQETELVLITQLN